MTRKTSSYARKRAHLSSLDRRRYEVINPVTEAVVMSQIKADIERLRTGCQLHAFIGEDAAKMTNLCGRLVYIACYAAGQHGLGETPEARILAGTANALGDLKDRPDSLEKHRAAIQSGMSAIDRLLPLLHPINLAHGALELDSLLNSAQGMGTSDIRQALAGQ